MATNRPQSSKSRSPSKARASNFGPSSDQKLPLRLQTRRNSDSSLDDSNRGASTSETATRDRGRQRRSAGKSSGNEVKVPGHEKPPSAVQGAIRVVRSTPYVSSSEDGKYSTHYHGAGYMALAAGSAALPIHADPNPKYVQILQNPEDFREKTFRRRLRHLRLLSAPTTKEILQMVHDLKINFLEFPQLVFLADEILVTPLPIGWEYVLYEDGSRFYRQISTGSVTRYHPQMGRYKQIYRSLRNRIRRLRTVKVVFEEEADLNALKEVLTEEELAQVTTPEALLESEIRQKDSLELYHPSVSPDDVKQMCERLGVDPSKEYYLLHLVRATLTPYLPFYITTLEISQRHKADSDDEVEEKEDDAKSDSAKQVVYVNLLTGKLSKRNPRVAVYKNLVQVARVVHGDITDECRQNHRCQSWLEFSSRTKESIGEEVVWMWKTDFYDFALNKNRPSARSSRQQTLLASVRGDNGDDASSIIDQDEQIVASKVKEWKSRLVTNLRDFPRSDSEADAYFPTQRSRRVPDLENLPEQAESEESDVEELSSLRSARSGSHIPDDGDDSPPEMGTLVSIESTPRSELWQSAVETFSEFSPRIASPK